MKSKLEFTHSGNGRNYHPHLLALTSEFPSRCTSLSLIEKIQIVYLVTVNQMLKCYYFVIKINLFLTRSISIFTHMLWV